MYGLEVPATFASFRVQCYQAGTKQTVTRTEAAVVIDRRWVSWNIDDVVLRIGC